jgi:4-hydroxyphenylpyruvate dioxygenase-like putative hemolysin
MRLAIAQVGSLQLELIEPLEGPSVYKEFLAEKGEGLHHIQSRIENVDETLAAFKEMGINILMSGKFGEGEFYYMDTEPVLGTVYELVKRRTRPPPEATYPPK